MILQASRVDSWFLRARILLLDAVLGRVRAMMGMVHEVEHRERGCSVHASAGPRNGSGGEGRRRTELKLGEYAVPVRGGLDPRGLVALAVEREAGRRTRGQLGVVARLLALVLLPAPEPHCSVASVRAHARKGWKEADRLSAGRRA